MITWLLKFLGIYDLIMWLGASGDTQKEGASARKMTAFSLNLAALFLVYKYSEKPQWEHFETVLIILLSAAAFFQALITVPDLLKGMSIFKGNKEEISSKETTTIESESTKINKTSNEL